MSVVTDMRQVHEYLSDEFLISEHQSTQNLRTHDLIPKYV